MKAQSKYRLAVTLSLTLLLSLACTPGTGEQSTGGLTTNGNTTYTMTTGRSVPESTTTARPVLEYFEMGQPVTRSGLTVTVDSVYSTNGYRTAFAGPLEYVIDGSFLFINFTVINETGQPLEVYETVGVKAADDPSLQLPGLIDLTERGYPGAEQRFFAEEEYSQSLIIAPGSQRMIQARAQVDDQAPPFHFLLLDKGLKPLAAIRVTPGTMDRYLTEAETRSTLLKAVPGSRAELRGIFSDRTKNFQSFYGAEMTPVSGDPSWLLVDARTGAITPGEVTSVGVMPPDYGMGNSNDNIANLGYAVRSGEWIWFRNDADHGSLYRVRTDGTGAVKQSDHRPIFLNAIDDSIYYMEEGEPGEERIWRIRSDGSELGLVTDTPAYYMRYAEDWFYCINITGQETDPDTNKLFRMKPDGTNIQMITNRSTWFFMVTGDTIYYQDTATGQIRRIYADGSGDEPVGDQTVRRFTVKNQFIYYLERPEDTAGIWRMKLDGTEPQKLSDDFTQGLNLADGWIYYAQTDEEDPTARQLKRMRPDGTEPQILTEDDHIMNLSIVGDWVYYSGPAADRVRKATLLRIDGTGRIDFFPEGY